MLVVVPVGLIISPCTSLAATVNCWCSPAALPASYQPTLIAGSLSCGPYAAIGVMVIGASKSAFLNSWAGTSSPIGVWVLGITAFDGSGSPTLIGISSVSMIRCSDGSLAPPRPAAARPRSRTVFVPPLVATASVAAFTPTWSA